MAVIVYMPANFYQNIMGFFLLFSKSNITLLLFARDISSVRWRNLAMDHLFSVDFQLI